MEQENPFFQQFGSNTRNNDDDEEINEETIKEAQQDPKFNKFMENVLEMDKEKYFLMLAHQGAKLPNDFDITWLRQNERASKT